MGASRLERLDAKLGNSADCRATIWYDPAHLPRLRALLTEFPAEDTSDLSVALPYLTAIPMGMCAARFIAYFKGRNDI